MKNAKMSYSTEPRERIYIKGREFLSFAKSMGKNLSNKYGQILLDSIKNLQQATDDLIGNKYTDKITSVSKNQMWKSYS